MHKSDHVSKKEYKLMTAPKKTVKVIMKRMNSIEKVTLKNNNLSKAPKFPYIAIESKNFEN